MKRALAFGLIGYAVSGYVLFVLVGRDPTHWNPHGLAATLNDEILAVLLAIWLAIPTIGGRR